MKHQKLLAAAAALALLCGCGSAAPDAAETPTPTAQQTAAPVQTDDYADAHTLTLRSEQSADGTWTHAAELDGAALEEFDYVWHADPSAAHDAVKNSPAEYYTGTEPETDAAAYIAHDVYYYPELDTSGFQKQRYDGETEWVYYYTAEGYTDYIFSTLPVQGSAVPEQMMHAESEAYENAVLHLTEPGTYVVSGTWHGQLWIDLGDTDETFADPDAKVTLILNGAEIDCTVAPGVVFYSVYECDNAWETRESYGADADTADAGANVILADGTENSVSGANIYRMLKTRFKSDDAVAGTGAAQKKMRKTDGAFYSYVSMNVTGGAEGSGVLNITSTFEGLDTELHLTVNGGNINIFAQDDGINVNEDGVSVLTVNGGSLHILAGLGSEGDGIDSNGYVVINGGTVVSLASPMADSGLDSDCGTYVNGGTVVALGAAMDWAESNGSENAGQAAVNLSFSQRQSADEAIVVTDADGAVVFAYDPDKDEVAEGNARWYSGAILSAPGLTVGGEYYVYVGGDVEGEETAGVYDPATVTGFTADAKQQCWTGTGTLGGFGGGPGGFGGGGGVFDPNGSGTAPAEPPEGFGGDAELGTGEAPEGFFGGGKPDDAPERPGGDSAQGFGERPTPPDGEVPADFDPSSAPEKPGGDFDPGSGERPTPPGGGFAPNGSGDASGEGEVVFTLNEKVNGFTGVRDAE